MEKRLTIDQALPETLKAMYTLSGSITKSNLKLIHKHLIKIRASQINSCAFCIDMHTKEALKSGETQQRIFVLSAWRETSLFTPEEQAILTITEEVTLIHQKGLSEETYAMASQYFDAATITEIIMHVVVINAWNRIAVSTHLPIPA